MNDPYAAIVIGTSAGGLTALSRLLENLPADFSVPLIIVQHRSKEPRDLLEEILQQRTRLVVKQADEKEQIKKGIVYIAPPDYHLLIEEDQTFSLTADERVCYSRPSIDVLFDSAAGVYKEKLIGIILTGANADGSQGIISISRNRGITISQDPEEAQYSTMPQAAIQTGKVRYILPLQKISDFLIHNCFGEK